MTALTKKQAAALDVFNLEGELNEGMIYERCWPLVRNVRLVTNALVEKGLVTIGSWWDEGVGYELILTDSGREAANALNQEEGRDGG
jgi:hypothetical protein